MHNLLQAMEWSNQKFVGPGLQVYGLAMPLMYYTIAMITMKWSKNKNSGDTITGKRRVSGSKEKLN